MRRAMRCGARRAARRHRRHAGQSRRWRQFGYDRHVARAGAVRMRSALPSALIVDPEAARGSPRRRRRAHVSRSRSAASQACRATRRSRVVSASERCPTVASSAPVRSIGGGADDPRARPPACASAACGSWSPATSRSWRIRRCTASSASSRREEAILVNKSSVHFRADFAADRREDPGLRGAGPDAGRSRGSALEAAAPGIRIKPNGPAFVPETPIAFKPRGPERHARTRRDRSLRRRTDRHPPRSPRPSRDRLRGSAHLRHRRREAAGLGHRNASRYRRHRRRRHPARHARPRPAHRPARRHGRAADGRDDQPALPLDRFRAVSMAAAMTAIPPCCSARRAISPRHRDFAGTAIFIFQPAEEGLGGARAMLADGLFQRFPCDEIYGLHNSPVYRCRPGARSSRARRWRAPTSSTSASRAAAPCRHAAGLARSDRGGERRWSRRCRPSSAAMPIPCRRRCCR